MTGPDDLIAALEAVHAAGLDAEHWPRALAGIVDLLGGVGATLEVIEKPNLLHREFHFCGLPPLAQLEYLDHYFGLNPRAPYAARQKAGELGWDYQILDEAAMNRSPFYMEFLARMDLRYFFHGIVDASAREFATLTVQRSPKQGHAGRASMALMQRILPHMRQALDVARRLKGADEPRRSLERALDWLNDGVALMRADRTVAYANEAFQNVLRRNDGVRVRRGAVEFSAPKARVSLDAALGDIGRLRAGQLRRGIADFYVARSSGAAPYLVSIRPIPKKKMPDGAVVAMVFIRDPVIDDCAAIETLRAIFGFTETEAQIAQALQSGMSLGDYARARLQPQHRLHTPASHQGKDRQSPAARAEFIKSTT